MEQVQLVEKFCKRSDIHNRFMRRKNGLYLTRLEFRPVRFAKNVSYLKSKQFLSFHFTGFVIRFSGTLTMRFPLLSFLFLFFPSLKFFT